jgi:hypothetical protein
MTRPAAAFALRATACQARDSYYRQMRLIHVHFRADPESLGEEQFAMSAIRRPRRSASGWPSTPAVALRALAGRPGPATHLGPAAALPVLRRADAAGLQDPARMARRQGTAGRTTMRLRPSTTRLPEARPCRGHGHGAEQPRPRRGIPALVRGCGIPRPARTGRIDAIIRAIHLLAATSTDPRGPLRPSTVRTGQTQTAYHFAKASRHR